MSREREAIERVLAEYFPGFPEHSAEAAADILSALADLRREDVATIREQVSQRSIVLTGHGEAKRAEAIAALERLAGVP